MDEQSNKDKNYIIVGLAAVFLSVVAIFATLLFVGLVCGFCICPFIWPKMQKRLQRFIPENKKDKRIKELETEIAKLKEH